jgi:hypothetical protein
LQAQQHGGGMEGGVLSPQLQPDGCWCVASCPCLCCGRAFWSDPSRCCCLAAVEQACRQNTGACDHTHVLPPTVTPSAESCAVGSCGGVAHCVDRLAQPRLSQQVYICICVNIIPCCALVCVGGVVCLLGLPVQVSLGGCKLQGLAGPKPMTSILKSTCCGMFGGVPLAGHLLGGFCA